VNRRADVKIKKTSKYQPGTHLRVHENTARINDSGRIYVLLYFVLYDHVMLPAQSMPTWHPLTSGGVCLHQKHEFGRV